MSKPRQRQPESGGSQATLSDTEGQVSAECERYGAQMQSLGRIQQSLARRIQGGVSKQQAMAIQSQVVANSKKMFNLIDLSRHAGCHNVTIPQQYRRQFDRQFR